jgi:hypothetical protein
MIAAVADWAVRMPPREMLGRFTQPGDPRAIAGWLEAQVCAGVAALVVSTDMLAYGGLVASRAAQLSAGEALERLAPLRAFKRRHPAVPILAFGVLMRVAPTATAASRPYRDRLARWAELSDSAARASDPRLTAELAQLERELAPDVTTAYRAARRRNLDVTLALLDWRRAGALDALVLLQDDARRYGPHREERELLIRRLRQVGLEDRVPVYNGTDEGAMVLASRAILGHYREVPRVAVVYSSERSRAVVPPFEDRPLELTVASQVRASGAELAAPTGPRDYTLYVNGPETSPEELEPFQRRLVEQLGAGRPVALADVLFAPPHRSGADQRIVAALERANLLDRLEGYAAWNTAGNSLGTAIPHANLRALFRKRLDDGGPRAARATAAHLEFLMHRFAGDYLYHDVVRPELNDALRREGLASDELAGPAHDRLARAASDALRPRIEELFDRHFRGREHRLGRGAGAGGPLLRIDRLEDLRVGLPWPRTFEAAIEYRFTYSVDRSP